MYRELAFYMRFSLILSIFIMGTASCSLKFGAEARQAAENADKTQPKQEFVEVDNTQAEPAAKQAVNFDKQAKQSPDLKQSKKEQQPAENAARYVRIGKNRRIRISPPQRSSESENTTHNDEASTAEHGSGQSVNNVAKTGSLHQKINSNIRSVHRKIVDKLTGRIPVKEKVLYPRVQLYGAKIDQSKWVLTSTELECSLTQLIPRLGKVKFKYNPVQFLKFIFEVNHPVARNLATNDKRYTRALLTDHYPYPDIGAKLESIPPNWKPFAIKKSLGYIPFKEGYEPFVLPHRQRLLAMSAGQQMKRKMAKGQQQIVSISKTYLPEIWPDRLMYELDEGMSIRLTYRDWTDGTQDIITTISPINFAKVKRNFEKCISERPKYYFNKLQKTVLHFNKDQRVLSKKLRKQLRSMVQFVKLDKEIKKVIIKSYTDSVGFKRINRNAAKAQAQAIKRYMKKLGMQVPITTIGIGEGPYVASNRSSAGRAKNRRSIITLIK